jgi:hypothetical protein
MSNNKFLRKDKSAGSFKQEPDEKSKNKRTSEHTKQIKTYGIIKDFPLLNYVQDGHCNFDDFSEAVNNYCCKHFRVLAHFFHNGTVPVLSPPAMPDGQLNIVQTTILNEETRIYVQNVRDLEEEKTRLYATIWGNISSSSQQKVKETGFTEGDNDPEMLWRRILQTHKVGGQFGVDPLDKLSARKNYNNVRQFPNESVVDYHTRFIRAFKAYKTAYALDQPVIRPAEAHQGDDESTVTLESGQLYPDEATLAADFIDRLYGARFAQFKTDLYNNSVAGIADYPSTLSEALKRASQYKIVHRVNSGNIVSTFATDFRFDNKKNQSSTYADVHSNRNNNINESSQNNDKKKSKKKDKRKCNLCGGPHVIFNCPDLNEVKKDYENKKKSKESTTLSTTTSPANMYEFLDSESVSSHATMIVFPNKCYLTKMIPSDILLDNASQGHLFGNPDLVTDIRPAKNKMFFKGVSGMLKVSLEATFQPINITVGYHPESPANILSFAKVFEKVGKDRIGWNPSSNSFYLVADNGDTIVFNVKNSIYTYTPSSIALATITDNEKLYPKREVEKAKQVKEIERRLGYPSPAAIVSAINGGAIINLPITSQDVARSEIIYGSSVARIQGKTHNKKNDESKVELLPRVTGTSIHMHIDIMFINGHTFFVSVGTPICLTLVAYLGNNINKTRNISSIHSALESQVLVYKSANFKVTHISSDGEKAITVQHWLAKEGIILNIVGAGKHVPIIENKIKVIKESARSILHSLPFILPSKWIRYVVANAVYGINCIPSKGGYPGLAPREAFSGRKINFKKDLRVAFGDYAQVFVPNSDNTMRSRTQSAIALYHTGNIQGSVRFCILETQAIVSRDQFIVLPITEDIINRINEIAMDRVELVDELVGDLDEQPQDRESSLNYLPPERRIESTDIELPVDELPSASQDEVPTNINQRDEEFSNLPVPQAAIISRSRRSGGERDSMINLVNLAKVGNYSIKEGFQDHKRRAAVYEALYKELLQMHTKGVFSPARKEDVGPSDSLIPSRSFLKDKFTPDGQLSTIKLRLVAGGHRQDRALYDDISSPTASVTALFYVAALAALENRQVKVIDITGAYLNAKMKSKNQVFIKLNPIETAVMTDIDPTFKQYIDDEGKLVVKLERALYGCIESAKLWYEEMKAYLISIGFEVNPVEPCVFNIMKQSDQITIVLYVDDLFITFKRKSSIQWFIDLTKSKFHSITIHDGPIVPYLGMKFDFTSKGKVRISMEGYIIATLRTTNITEFSKHPASLHLFTVREDAIKLTEADKVHFHSMVARLLYLAKRVRPDILLPVNFLATRVLNPDEDDGKKLGKVLKYLNFTKNLALTLEPNPALFMPETYIDASFAVHPDMKSHTGMCIIFGKGCISAKSTKQKINTKSSAESEFVALSDCATDAIHLKQFVFGQCSSNDPAIIYQDNEASIALSNKGFSSSHRSRHISIKRFWICDRIANHDIVIKYCKTDIMISDLLTKPLTGDKFIYLRNALLNSQESI